jgi:hypothetical protein
MKGRRMGILLLLAYTPSSAIVCVCQVEFRYDVAYILLHIWMLRIRFSGFASSTSTSPTHPTALYT